MYDCELRWWHHMMRATRQGALGSPSLPRRDFARPAFKKSRGGGGKTINLSGHVLTSMREMRGRGFRVSNLGASVSGLGTKSDVVKPRRQPSGLEDAAVGGGGREARREEGGDGGLLLFIYYVHVYLCMSREARGYPVLAFVYIFLVRFGTWWDLARNGVLVMQTWTWVW